MVSGDFYGSLAHLKECESKHEIFFSFEELVNYIMEMLEHFETSAQNAFTPTSLLK